MPEKSYDYGGRGPRSELDSSILQSTSCDTRQIIADLLWGSTKLEGRLDALEFDLESYWHYYDKECRDALHDGGRHAAARTHRDILDVALEMKDDRSRTEIRKLLREKMTTEHPNVEELVDGSINLTASLVLMMNFGSQPYSFSGRRRLRWNSGALRDNLQAYFGEAPVLAHESVKLEKVFVARNLNKIAGLEFVWTDNLIDHLRLSDDDKRVHIFHHASFLERQCNSSETLFPQGLAEETLRTLALLFPTGDSPAKVWLSKVSGYEELDRKLGHCGSLTTDNRQIDRFFFWRDRLVMLKQAFDESQPKTILQWWHDRRNGVQWYTFWVAVLVLLLTIIFGVIQSIEGAMQVYASFKALEGPNWN